MWIKNLMWLYFLNVGICSRVSGDVIFIFKERGVINFVMNAFKRIAYLGQKWSAHGRSQTTGTGTRMSPIPLLLIVIIASPPLPNKSPAMLRRRHQADMNRQSAWQCRRRQNFTITPKIVPRNRALAAHLCPQQQKLLTRWLVSKRFVLLYGKKYTYRFTFVRYYFIGKKLDFFITC